MRATPNIPGTKVPSRCGLMVEGAEEGALCRTFPVDACIGLKKQGTNFSLGK